MAKIPDLCLISAAAELLEMHPQTLRKYERLGLVRPRRVLGSMRVYSREELDRLRLIKGFVDGSGINLAGVRRLLSIAEVAQAMRPLVTEAGRGRRPAAHRRLAEQVDALFRILELE